MGKPVDVEIMGQRFTLRSEQEEVYVRKVAGFVNDKIQEIVTTKRPVAKFNLAMLAALHIADEYHRLEERYQAMTERVNDLSKKISIALTEEG